MCFFNSNNNFENNKFEIHHNKKNLLTLGQIVDMIDQ